MEDARDPFVDSSEEELDEEYDFMKGEDNVLGNVYEGDEEEEEKEKQEKKKSEEKNEEEVEEAQDDEKEKPNGEKKSEEKKEEEDEQVEVKDASNAETVAKETAATAAEEPAAEAEEKEEAAQSKDSVSKDVYELDLSKVLEETSVPQLPTAELEGARRRGKHKSVSFASEQPREMKQKSIALVQPESNLVVPMEVDDEFDEFVNPRETPYMPPKFYQAKTILKKTQEESDGESEAAAENGSNGTEESTIVLGREENNREEEEEKEEEEEADKPADKPAVNPKVLQLGKEWDDDEEEEEEEKDTSSSGAKVDEGQTPFAPSSVVSFASPAEAMPDPTTAGEKTEVVVQVAAAGAAEAAATTTESVTSADVAGSSEEDTYLILVDGSGAELDESQTLYIDSSQLANGGDLSNMVLMTNEGVAVNAQGVSGSNRRELIANALNSANKDKLLQQQQGAPPQP